jgi:radical SAM superfamily enzyme YgiQ (UPF0313 family)
MVLDMKGDIAIKTSKSKKLVTFGTTYSAIESLGPQYLGGVALQEGWETRYVHVRNHDYSELKEAAKDSDVLLYTQYTGGHNLLFGALDEIRANNKSLRTGIGGPHGTYFPDDAIRHADYVGMSEGFNATRRILRNEVKPGIIEFRDEFMEEFPHPDRKGYYRDSPEHKASLIKSFIMMTGCRYRCTYCYNSTDKNRIEVPDSLRSPLTDIPLIQKSQSKKSGTGRLFPLNIRSLESIMKEVYEIMEIAPETLGLYDQSDIAAQNLTEFEPIANELKEVDLWLHGQLRWEMLRGDEGSRRLDLLRLAGYSGLTLAIESSNYHVRKEVLDRKMDEEIMFSGMGKAKDREFTIRTEQITGLPGGATSVETPINLDLDLDLLGLNVRLRKETGKPDIAWASTLAPYKKTKIGDYCAEIGHYDGDNNDVPDEFFDRSVLRFPRAWVGSEIGIAANAIKGYRVLRQEPPGELLEKYAALCADLRNNPDAWLSGSELEAYRDKNKELRSHFNTFALTPEGDVMARDYLESSQPFTYTRLGGEMEGHLISLQENREAKRILTTTREIRENDFGLNGSDKEFNNGMLSEIRTLAPYFATLEKPEILIERIIRETQSGKYKGRGENKNNNIITPYVLTTSVRRHLYDNVLYKTGDDIRLEQTKERYPPKV